MGGGDEEVSCTAFPTQPLATTGSNQLSSQTEAGGGLMTLLGVSLWNFVNLTKVDTK